MVTTQVQAATVVDLRQIAQNLLVLLRPGMVIGLSGSLGAGKTTFVKVLAELLGITEDVISPTYVYHQSYTLPAKINGITRLHHFDLYRVHSDQDFKTLDLSIDDPEGLVVIEWVDQVPELVHAADLIISFSVFDEVRTLRFLWRNQ
jgi:tRNA threonylcarbamoyladenosine biosynthesis protein TsaE